MLKMVSEYYKKLSSFNKIFLFFIITMLLLIIPTVIVSKYASNIIINKQIEANDNYVSYISKDTDNIFISSRNSCYSIMGNEYYENYIKYFKKYNKDFSLYSLKLINNIRNVTNNNPYLEDVFVYSYDVNTNEGYIISADGTHESQKYFDKIYVKDNSSSSLWSDLLKEQFSIKLLQSTSVDNKNGQAKSNVITMLVKRHYSTTPNTYMIVNINENVLFNNMKHSNITKNANVYILNKESGEFLNSNDDLDIKGFDNNKSIVKAIEEGKNNINIKLNNKNYIMSYQASDINNMYYVVITPKDIITADIRRVAYTSYFVIFSFSIIGIILSLFFTKKIYSPLGDTIKYIKGFTEEGEIEESYNNEYEYLRESFIKMRELQYNSTFNAMHILIYRAINNNISLQEVKELIKQYKLPLNKRYYAIMNIRISLLEAHKNVDIPRVKELFEPFGEFMELSPSRYICFMNIDSQEELNSNLHQLESNINDFVKAKPELSIYMSISDIFEDIMLIHNFYQESYNVLDMRSINITKRIYSKEDIGSDELHAYSKTELGYLSKYLSNVNEKDSLALLHKILNYCKDKNMTFIRFRQVIDELLFIALDVIEQKQIDPRNIFNDLKESLRKINVMQNPKDIEEKCIDIYNEILDYLKSKQKCSSILDEIFEYIDENTCVISLNDVADRFNMNTNYFSQYFKKHTGETFTSYVNNKKMIIAKEKLLNTDKTIEVISQELGFSNSSAFIRMFKQIEGVTPNVFRENSEK